MTSPTPPQAFVVPPALGWLLAVPALLGALITLVLPTAQTIWLSFQSGGVLRESTYVGMANYGKLLGDSGFWQALGFTLSLTVIPLLVAVVVGPLLALALDRAGTWPRRAGRIALSLAVVVFSPVAVAGAWLRGLMPNASGLATLAEGLTEPGTAPGTMRLIVAAGTFGVVCALAVIAFLPALRGGTPGPATLVVGVLVALAVVAVGLQTFSLGLVLTKGGPQRATETLAGLQYDFAFRQAQFGPGASVAALTGVILGVLGIVATVVAVTARLRITLTPRTPSPMPDGTSSAPRPPPGGWRPASGRSWSSSRSPSSSPGPGWTACSPHPPPPPPGASPPSSPPGRPRSPERSCRSAWPTWRRSASAACARSAAPASGCCCRSPPGCSSAPAR
ncbi:Maltose/maltodextrin ABC transporter, permease protein MalF [[Actinomadura] parvosata subsp. kistnae]|uniref:carbohydrate ABC transporter permease n=1 Tax=[Actinomadura] parvosata TaxID=1955412 RepID=UPI000D2DF6A4|nr:Maltose/maltodextrin ABC transporter, permease protein MalF [Actinomadura parvosata subsp. kistnae]